MSLRVSKYFTIKELVHPDIIKTLGEKRAAALIHPDLLLTLDKLRAVFGAIIVNGKFGGLTFTNSGIRKASYYKNSMGFIRQSYSTHQWGNTVDCKFLDTTPEEVYEYILKHPQSFKVIRMENAHKTKTWLHLECGDRRGEDIQVFNP